MSLLLLHGALGASQQLSLLQRRVGGVTIDLSGHGGRAIPSEGIRFEQFLTDIDDAFAENGWSSADLFGYSMGGYAALLYAAKHPARVRSVVTVGTKLIWTEEGLQKELRKLDPAVLEAKVPAFAKALADVHGRDRWRDVVVAIAQSMTVLARTPLLTEELVARIQCPVLCCVGEGDTTAVPDDTRLFAARLPNASVLVLPNTRHPFDEVDLDVLVPVLQGHWSFSGR